MLWRAGLLLVLLYEQVQAEDVPAGDAFEAEGKTSRQSRIVSGWDAYQHPYQALLRGVSYEGTVKRCGGSLVARHWVITTAHCIARRVTIEVLLGVTNSTTPQHIMESRERHLYPTYNEQSTAVQFNDIGMLKLPRPAVYTRLVQPIRIQSSTEAFREYNNEVMYASGLWTNGEQSEGPQWVYLRGITNVECQRSLITVNENTLCTTSFNVTSQSQCHGDGGGPLVRVDSDGVPILVGVFSFLSSSGCHLGLPTGNIRPGAFHNWFTNVTGIDFENFVEEEEVAIPIPVAETATRPPTTTKEPEDPTTILPTTTENPKDDDPTTTLQTTTEMPEDDELITTLPTTTKIPKDGGLATTLQTTTEKPIDDDPTTTLQTTTEKPKVDDPATTLQTTTENPEDDDPIKTLETTTENPNYDEPTTKLQTTTEKPEEDDPTTTLPTTTEKPDDDALTTTVVTTEPNVDVDSSTNPTAEESEEDSSQSESEVETEEQDSDENSDDGSNSESDERPSGSVVQKRKRLEMKIKLKVNIKKEYKVKKIHRKKRPSRRQRSSLS